MTGMLNLGGMCYTFLGGGCYIGGEVEPFTGLLLQVKISLFSHNISWKGWEGGGISPRTSSDAPLGGSWYGLFCWLLYKARELGLVGLSVSILLWAGPRSYSVIYVYWILSSPNQLRSINELLLGIFQFTSRNLVLVACYLAFCAACSLADLRYD